MNRVIKCILIGDVGVGKTCLISSYTANTFPQTYIPTVLDTYNALINVGKQVITLTIYDPSGKNDHNHSRLRQALLSSCDVILICYSCISLSSLLDIRAKWYPQIQTFAPRVPVILVGTHKDQQKLLTERSSLRCVDEVTARSLSRELAFVCQMSCSSLTQEGLKEVFDEAVRICLMKTPGTKKKKKNKRFCR